MFLPQSREVFIKKSTGEPYRKGERFLWPSLGETLREVAEKGAEAVYGEDGEAGKKLLKDLAEMGTIIAKEDLRRYT